MTDFAGKVVLVTGGTRGIGRACVGAFANQGARVALCGRQAETATAAAAQVAGETGAEVHGFAADIGDAGDVDALVKAVREDLGPIAVLVNNAGLTRDGLAVRMRDEDWNAVLDANLSGAFRCCRAVSRDMLKARWGRIVNISSIVGLRGQAGQANYAAAKAGLIGLTKALAHELATRNVTVNAVAPGYIDTDMTAALGDDFRAAALDRIPMKRFGFPEEVAAAVTFLAGDAASYITGTVISVDGGLAM